MFNGTVKEKKGGEKEKKKFFYIRKVTLAYTQEIEVYRCDVVITY